MCAVFKRCGIACSLRHGGMFVKVYLVVIFLATAMARLITVVYGLRRSSIPSA